MAKAESWQKTCFSLSSKTRLSKFFSLLRLISGSSFSSSSDISNFPRIHTPEIGPENFGASIIPYFYSNHKILPKSEGFYINEIRYAYCNLLQTTFCTPFCSPFTFPRIFLSYLPTFKLNFCWS